MVAGEDIISSQIAHERSLREVKVVRRNLLEIPRNDIVSVLDKNDKAQEKGERVRR